MNHKEIFSKSDAPSLIRNTALNFFTQIWLLLLFMVSTPIVVHGLGDEIYGILSLVLVLVGYFGFLDLGMSQATVKFVSEHLARGERERLCQVVSTSIFTNLALGILGGILIALFTPLFAEKIFKVSSSLEGEARFAFYIFAIGFPAILIQGTLQAIPTAFQRFDIINLINGVAGSLQALVSMGLVLLGFGLKEVVIAYIIIRFFSAAVYFLVIFKLLPDIQLRPRWHHPTFIKLLHFGGWILISAVVGPLMVNFDRILIGSLISVAAVTYYVVPYGIVSKLGVIHGSTLPVLFPAFSERGTLTDKAFFNNLFIRSIRLLFIVLTPLVFVLVIFAGEILKLWIGVDFAQKSTAVAQILALAVLVNGFATIPFVAIQGFGRPDLTGKFHLIELPIYIGLCFLLIPLFGINGAAWAWAIRVTIDAILLFWAVKRLSGLEIQETLSNSLKKGFLFTVSFAFILFLIKSFTGNLIIQGIGVLTNLVFYILILWKYGLDEIDKKVFLKSSFLRREVAP